MKKILSVFLTLTIFCSFAVFADARLVGDVDKNGKTNSQDALQILMYAVGMQDTIDKKAADTDNDGTINSADALIVLQISVGIYEGEPEIEDELVTSYYADTVEPILKSKKYTLTTSVISEGKEIPTTIMMNGNDICADISALGTESRILVLDGQTYIVFPKLKVYMKYGKDFPLDTTDRNYRYTKSEYKEFDGKTYVCETYTGDGGYEKRHYFLDGVWSIMETADPDGTVSTKSVRNLKAGVDPSCFSLKGLIEISPKAQ